MAYYDKETSDELKDKFKTDDVPTGDDFSGLISYFDQGLQGVDEAMNKVSITPAKGDKGDTGATGPQGPKGDTGATGPKGDDGLTPEIDSNGHWKIGDTTTQYSVGMEDQDDSATFLDLNTDKAVYYPSEKVVFRATSVSGHGRLVVKYYHLNNLVDTKKIYYGTSELSWSWFLPADDNTGYAVVIENHVGNNVSTTTIAINVSNDIYNFPIMGFLSKYDTDYPLQRKEVLEYMKRLHINLIQFYDWQDLHSVPLPVSYVGDSTLVSSNWTDIGKRLTRKNVIEDYCNLAKEYGMNPLAYMAINGSDTNQLIHGLSADMFLYDDNSKNLDHAYKTVDMNNGWSKYSLYNMNWMNGPWQDYICNQMQIVRDNTPFGGWHIDMIGIPTNKYDGNGNPIPDSVLENGIHYFLNRAGKLDWDIGINSPGEYGISDMEPVTYLKYLYTEVWDNRKTYDDMFRMIRGLKESTDSNNKKKGVILAAYMNYDYAKGNSGKDFNIDGVILADLVIMASGGTHLEMGEHMLCNDYFPNSNLNLPTQLSSDYLPKIYDFFVAFKEIIGLGHQVDNLATIENGSVDSLKNGNVCGISHGDAHGYLGLSLINLNTANTDWRDTNATCSVTSASNVKVTINLGVTNHNWYYFDLDNLEPQTINVGSDGVVNIPELHYFGFILGALKADLRNLALGTTTPFTMTGTNSSNQTQLGYQFSSVIPNGTVVTATFDITSSTGVGTYSILFNGNDTGAVWQPICNGNLVNGTQHVSATITTQGNNLHITTRLDNATGTVTISNFIISESSKEVSWTPAPEDALN